MNNCKNEIGNCILMFNDVFFMKKDSVKLKGMLIWNAFYFCVAYINTEESSLFCDNKDEVKWSDIFFHKYSFQCQHYSG